MRVTEAKREKPNIYKKLKLTCGFIVGPLFASLFSLAAWSRVDYDWVRFPISSLSIGPTGGLQATNFVIAGSLVALCGVGLQSRAPSVPLWTSRLVILSGIGLIGAGFCTSDPVYGYPPSLPLRLSQFTLHGKLHDVCSMLFFGSIVAAAVIDSLAAARRGEGRTAVISGAAATAFIILFVVASLAFRQVQSLVSIAGLLQRATVMVGMAWLAWLSWTAFRSCDLSGGTVRG